jgi:antitoxin YefM
MNQQTVVLRQARPWLHGLGWDASEGKAVVTACLSWSRITRQVQFSVHAMEVPMRTVNLTQLRRNLAAELDSVINDAEEVVVTRSGHEPVVIVPLAEYESMKETEYLLGNPNNAAALRRSIAELEQGDVHERKLIDPATAPEVA